METPSSITRRVTRSQALVALNNSTTTKNIPISRRIEESENGGSKSRQKQQQALIDITNDSPIVGVATGGLETPSSAVSKQRRTIRAKNNNNTPGSGETLLRCQVKTLLQKVEEEAELSKISLETRPFLHLQGFVNSPMRLLAPTPANTPQFLNLSEDDSSIAIQEQMISQVVNDIFDIQESIESDINLISRSLLLDFSEKTESTECSSVVTDDSKEKSCPDDDGDSSVWSTQVNEEEQVVEENEAEEYDAGLIDQLCEEMCKISVNNNAQKITKFTGRHTRFLYNSDDEIVEEPASGGVFKGLPTPKGKHIRFAIEEEETEY